MELICQNCNQEFNQSFCGNCGQKKYKRIDKKYIWDEIQYTVLHTNKGFLYSVKNILKNPGKTAREFIEGNRVNHYKPILLTFVLSGISAFISFKILGLKEIYSTIYAKQNISSAFVNDYMTFISSYNSILMLLLIPVFALFTKLAFKKWEHNYYEHIVLNSYILSYYTLLTILFLYPIMYFLKGNNETIIQITSYSMLFFPFILFWFFKEFYKEKETGLVVVNTIITLVITIIGFLMLMLLAMLIGIAYAYFNPEMIQYLKPT